MNRPDFCRSCPIGHLTHGYVGLKLRGTVHHELLVGDPPTYTDATKTGESFSDGMGLWVKNIVRGAKKSWDSISTLNVMGCHPPEGLKGDFYQAGLDYCSKHHLFPLIRRSGREKIYALGDEALRQLTARDGIHTWRGSPLPLVGRVDKPRVIPTLPASALMKQPKLSSVVVGDFRKSTVLPPENYNLFPTVEEVERFTSRVFAFDLEWDSTGAVTLCGLSDRFYSAIVVPWSGPYLDVLRRIFEGATDLIGHNIISADLPFLEKEGWDISRARIHDTILKQHLVQPDYPRSLAFVASVFTNRVYWKGRWEEEESEELDNVNGQQWRTWDKGFAIPRKLGGYGGCQSAAEAFNLYNARDTAAEFEVNTPISHLLTKYQLEDVYNYVSVPVAFLCRDMAERGVKIDASKLGSIREEIDKQIEAYEGRLPEGLAPYYKTVSCNLQAPKGTYRPKTKVCKGTRKAPHAEQTVTFERPGEAVCPVCERRLSSGKMVLAKIVRGTRQERVVPYNSPPLVQAYVAKCELEVVYDAKTGRKTTGKRARKAWAKTHPEFAVLGGLKQQITLRNNFAKDSLLTEPRMFFNLKVFGTAEGRLSSSGRRRGIDLNIQNQPKEFRAIYVPDRPDWGWLNLDIVQGENMLTTWLAKDWERWERINAEGYDEHCDLASRIFGRAITKAEADKPFRDIGKKINHGRNYGMGARKQLDSLIENGFEHYTESDVREFIEIWKGMNKRTAEWQTETIGQAQKDGYLRNAFGRVRWFSSKATATQALAFLPASTLADMVLRMMVCHYPSHPRCRPAIESYGLSVWHDIVPGWIMALQVHDSITHQGPQDSWKEQAERSKAIMEQPWHQLDNFRFKASIGYSPNNLYEATK